MYKITNLLIDYALMMFTFTPSLLNIIVAVVNTICGNSGGGGGDGGGAGSSML